jgi:hypothetical protein
VDAWVGLRLEIVAVPGRIPGGLLLGAEGSNNNNKMVPKKTKASLLMETTVPTSLRLKDATHFIVDSPTRGHQAACLASAMYCTIMIPKAAIYGNRGCSFLRSSRQQAHRSTGDLGR